MAGKVLVKHDKVVILGHILAQTVVFAHKTDQFVRGSIVGQPFRSYALICKHLFEKGQTVATSLTTFVDVEIEHTQWCNLLNLTLDVSDEKFSRSNFQKADCLISTHTHVHPIITVEKF